MALRQLLGFRSELHIYGEKSVEDNILPIYKYIFTFIFCTKSLEAEKVFGRRSFIK